MPEALEPDRFVQRALRQILFAREQEDTLEMMTHPRVMEDLRQYSPAVAMAAQPWRREDAADLRDLLVKRDDADDRHRRRPVEAAPSVADA